MSYRQTLDFLLYDWLDVEALQRRPRFADHSRETFASVMDTCERLAREKFAPFNRQADTEEPRFDGERGRVYRLSVQGFGSSRQAFDLCGSLKRAGAACFVRNVAGDAPVQLASR